jgi:hypothetical protein
MNRIDVSRAVDLLLRGAAPERVTELSALWGGGEDRVHLTDGGGFDIGEFFGVIQTTEITLRQIWLLSFAAWRAIEAYNGILELLSHNGLPFNREEVAGLPRQAAADKAFDEALSKARELREAIHLDSVKWPSDIPEPAIDNKFVNRAHQVAFNLACIAGAYIFLHEIQHVRFGKLGTRPSHPHDEEMACDHFARNFLTANINLYVAQSGEPIESVRAKRALGIAVAMIVILEVTPLEQWQGTDHHPPVGVRVRSFLENLGGEVTENFWISIASFLAAMCRSRGRLPQQIEFHSPRQLAFSLANCL